MKKRNTIFKIIFSLFVVSLLLGCKEDNKFIQKRKEGYSISVRYEANGGTYLDRDGITIVDMFNPNDYQKDDSGVIHIKLIEPTDPSRPSGGSEGIYITVLTESLDRATPPSTEVVSRLMNGDLSDILSIEDAIEKTAVGLAAAQKIAERYGTTIEYQNTTSHVKARFRVPVIIDNPEDE